MAHWRYYEDNTGALVNMAYAKHAAHLLHRVTHNHQPEVREAAAIRIKESTNGPQHLPAVDTGTTRCRHLRGHRHLGPAAAPPTAYQARHPDEPPLRSAGATLGHAHRHPPTPGGRGGHPAPRGSHHHHSLHHANADQDHGPVRPPRRPVPFRPAMVSTLRLPGVPPRMRYNVRARHAGAEGHPHGVQGFPAPAPPTQPEGARGPKGRQHNRGGAQPVSRKLDTTHLPATGAKGATNMLPALSSDTIPPGPSPSRTPRRPMYHRSDTVSRAYRARAGTAARQPLTLRGPCYTSSPPTTTPPPPPPPPTSRHGYFPDMADFRCLHCRSRGWKIWNCEGGGGANS